MRMSVVGYAHISIEPDAMLTGETRLDHPVQHQVDDGDIAHGHQGLGCDIRALVERVQAGR